MNEKKTSRSYWESDNESYLMYMLAGDHFGNNALAAKDKIEDEKKLVAVFLQDLLQVSQDSTGLEIGSGFGLLTKHMAKLSAFVQGCDISESFLQQARKECQDVKNCSFTQIKPGDLSAFKSESFDFIYSNNVFIHLDFYEICAYLEQGFNLLKPGGRMYFDVAEAERVNFAKDADFILSLKLRKQDPFHKSCVHHNSSRAIANFAKHLGFYVVERKDIYQSFTTVLLKKPKGSKIFLKLLDIFMQKLSWFKLD